MLLFTYGALTSKRNASKRAYLFWSACKSRASGNMVWARPASNEKMLNLHLSQNRSRVFTSQMLEWFMENLSHDPEGMQVDSALQNVKCSGKNHRSFQEGS